MPFLRYFVSKEPAARDVMKLARINSHPRDRLISFDEQSHAYYVLHEESDTYLKARISVSGLYGFFFEEFDKISVSRNVAKKRKTDKSSPYYWLLQTTETEEDGANAIMKAWEAVGNRASTFGTKSHLDCEMQLNSEDSDFVNDETIIPGATQHAVAAIKWMRRQCLAKNWQPFRTEYSIFIDMREPASKDGDLFKHHDAILCGQVDCLFKGSDDGRYIMVDFKYCASDKLDQDNGAFRGEVPKGKYPVDNIPNNSYGHYLCQQSIYGYILKKRYDIVVSEAYLLHVATDAEDIRAKAVKLTLLPDEVIEKMFETYVKTL